MRFLRAKKNDNKIEFTLPDSAEEITWLQGRRLSMLHDQQELSESESVFQIVSILTDVEPSFWRETKDLASFNDLANECIYLFEEFVKISQNTEARSPQIQFEGKAVNMPDNLGTLSVGQYFDGLSLWQGLQKDLEQRKEEDQNAIPSIPDTLNLYQNLFKIYLFPLVRPEAKYDAQEVLKLNIDDLLYTDVISYAAFFLSSLTTLKTGTPPKSSLWGILKMKYKQVMRKPQKG